MKEQAKIHLVGPKQLREMLRQYIPRGLFLAKDGCKWVALDNSTCEAWVEEFRHKHQAVRWLRGKFEVGDKAKQRVRTFNSEEKARAFVISAGVDLEKLRHMTIMEN